MADEKDIAEDLPQGAGRKKLIILIAGVVLLLLVGGVAAYLLVSGDEDATAEGAGAEDTQAVAEQGDPEYYRLDPTFIVNLAPGGPARMLQVAIEVLTYQSSVIAALQANDPMIRHHLLNLLERQQAADLMTAAGKEALQQAIHELLSERLAALNAEGEIKGVFFTQFVMQ
jgi:flagellar FliL protein